MSSWSFMDEFLGDCGSDVLFGVADIIRGPVLLTIPLGCLSFEAGNVDVQEFDCVLAMASNHRGKPIAAVPVPFDQLELRPADVVSLPGWLAFFDGQRRIGYSLQVRDLVVQ